LGLERRKDKGEKVIRFTICPFVGFNPFQLIHIALLPNELA
jgi:hypothetical protein